MKIAVVSIPVSDQDRAKQFYTDILGFTVNTDTSMGPDMRWLMLDAPHGGPAITLVTWFPSMPAGSSKGLVIAVDDVQATHDELVAKGIKFADGIQEQPWGRFVTLDDPDGNGLILQQPPAWASK